MLDRAGHGRQSLSTTTEVGMSDQSEPREQTAASTEQVLETKDLEPRIEKEKADQVRGGQGSIEIQDYGFGVSMPVTTSRSDGGGATVGRAK
jgi:hypothetical protein